MFQNHKYDIAISVAEEDILIANELGKALHKKGIKYYLYTEHPEDAGKALEDILFDVYGKKSWLTVVLWSSAYRTGFWALKEREVTKTLRKRKVLVRLDDTPLEDGDENYIFLEWEKGINEISKALFAIIRPFVCAGESREL